MSVKKLPPSGKDVKIAHAVQCTKSRMLNKGIDAIFTLIHLIRNVSFLNSCYGQNNLNSIC